MQDLIKQSASEFEKKFSLLEDDPETRGITKGILDWHTKQMEKAYNKGRSDREQEIIDSVKKSEEKIGDMLYDWDAYPSCDKQAKEVVEYIIGLTQT